MKKILFTLACLLGMSTAASAIQSAAVMLQHDGKITTYEPEQINDAIAAAVDGDVVILSEGDFPAFTIDKSISVKGTGMQTVIKGQITIEKEGAILNDVFIGYMHSIGDGSGSTYSIRVNTRVKGLKISQCRLNKGIYYNAITEESYIDRCKLESPNGLRIDGQYTETVTVNGKTSSYTRSYLQGLTVTNSDIRQIYGQTGIYQDVTFINCFITSEYREFSLCGTKIINSILLTGYNIGLNKVEIVNSSYVSSGSYKVGFYNDTRVENCYDVAISDYTSSDIAANGYLGNDGTIIGPLGGNTPYTLEPAVPTVTESSMKVDTDKQQLQVTLTVSPK